MNQQDFLLREIQKISQVLIALIDKVTGLGTQDLEKEINEIDNVLTLQFDFDISSLIKISNQDLLIKLNKLNENQLETFVELVKKYNLIENNKNIDARGLLSKGFFLINELNSKSKDYSIHRTNLYKQLLILDK